MKPFTGLLKHLPENGWTREQRDRFLEVFAAILDFLVPITEPDKEKEDDTDDRF
jgi:hypothetical protein